MALENQEVPLSRLGLRVPLSLCLAQAQRLTWPGLSVWGRVPIQSRLNYKLVTTKKRSNQKTCPVLSTTALLAWLLCLSLGLETMARMTPLHDGQWPELTIPLSAVLIKSNI